MNHYLFGVGIEDAYGSNPGEVYLDGLLHYTSEEYTEAEASFKILDNIPELLEKETRESIAKATNKFSILPMMKMRSSAQGTILCKIVTDLDNKLTRSQLESYIKQQIRFTSFKQFKEEHKINV